MIEALLCLLISTYISLSTSKIERINRYRATIASPLRVYSFPRSFVLIGFQWSEIKILHHLSANESGNVNVGNYKAFDTYGSIVYSDNENETIVTLGVSDVVVVRQGDVTIVIDKKRSQDIKKILGHLPEELL